MNKSFVKFFDKIIVLLLGFSGVFSSCESTPWGNEDPVCEYGVPHAEFEIKGTVTNKANSQPIQNIRVIRQIHENFGDTLYTDSDGKYTFEFQDFPHSENVFHLKIEDIDGGENGGLFDNQEIDVKITKADQVKRGNGSWYNGKFAKTQNIELERIDIAYPEYGVFPATFKP